MTTIAYTRVSTREQSESGLSMGAQGKAVRDYCALYGLGKPEILRENGRSAKSLKGRPTMASLLDRVRSGEVGHVVVYKIDRMFRSLADAQKVLEMFRTKGAQFHSVQEKWDTSTAIGEAMLNIVLVFAQLERRQTGERTRDVLRSRKQSKGGSAILDHRQATGKLLVGQAPFGFKYRGKTLVEHPDETIIVRYIHQLQTTGVTPPAIARALNDEGHTSRAGGVWHPVQVRRILEREYYGE